MDSNNALHSFAHANGAYHLMGCMLSALVQAVFEGVAFAMRDCLEIAKSQGVSITEATICGGGAKSKLWREIMANVLGITIGMVQTEQGPSYGAAILAAVACGVYASVEEATGKIVSYGERLEPDASICTKYDAKYQKFKQLYPMLRDFY